ncbi:MAG: response regulator [Caulobacterales bacterium]|nr:response regulator [Caulobacterales bacterium]
MTSIELARRGTWDRIGFAAIFGVIGLYVVPWMASLAWVSVIVAWELLLIPAIDRVVSSLREEQGALAFVVTNFFGGVVYQWLALFWLADGSHVGVAMATTWIAGAILTTFIHFNANPRLLVATMLPLCIATVVGPTLAYGFSWEAVLIPALLGLYLLSARRFSVDHGAILRQLADRQVAFADLERKLSIAVEASGDGMFEMDLLRQETQVSPAWLAMLGYAPGDFPSPMRGVRDLIHPDDLTGLWRAYEEHFEGQTPYTASELRMRCKDGSYKWVLSRGRLVARAPDGRPWRVVGTTIDISERKALEHQLEAARDLAESANTAKSAFVANMSHEIRTPLNGVIGIAGALARTRLSASQREMVALVESSGMLLERLLSDILDQAKIEAGKFQLQVANFDLRQEIGAAAELMRVRADEKGLAFQVAYSDTASGWFEGDAVRIRQIISNLASNAIKFTAAGEVAVRVDLTRSDQAGGPAILSIEVADTRIGFDSEVAGRLFGRFVQADGSNSRKFGGTGLGLAICKALIELMGGEITAASTPGEGSVFRVTIPLRPAIQTGEQPRPFAEPNADGGAPDRRLRILLAEDHPTNQRVVQLILEPVGIELMTVDNGQEAVGAYAPGRFDLILMDMQMPVMDGLAATRAIRALERNAGWPPTPIAMFTANAMDEHLLLAAQAGANHHISKPITPERLLAGIEHALNPEPDAASPALEARGR